MKRYEITFRVQTDWKQSEIKMVGIGTEKIRKIGEMRKRKKKKNNKNGVKCKGESGGGQRNRVHHIPLVLVVVVGVVRVRFNKIFGVLIVFQYDCGCDTCDRG